MSITDSALQTLIISEVGDVIVPPAVTGILAQNMATIWAKHQQYRPISDLQFLFAKREATQTVITALRTEAVRVRVGDFDEDDSAWVSALEKLSGDLGAQIIERIKTFAASHAGVMTQLVTTQIEQPPDFQPPDPYSGAVNANSAYYRGDPYARRSGGIW